MIEQSDPDLRDALVGDLGGNVPLHQLAAQRMVKDLGWKPMAHMLSTLDRIAGSEIWNQQRTCRRSRRPHSAPSACGAARPEQERDLLPAHIDSRKFILLTGQPT